MTPDLKKLKSLATEGVSVGDVNVLIRSSELLAIIERNEKLERLAKWSGHLIGDFTCAEERPTHFNSWFGFVSAFDRVDNCPSKLKYQRKGERMKVDGAASHG